MSFVPVFFFITEDSYGFFKVACLNFSDGHYTILSKGPELVLFASWVISVGCTFSIFY